MVSAAMLAELAAAVKCIHEAAFLIEGNAASDHPEDAETLLAVYGLMIHASTVAAVLECLRQELEAIVRRAPLQVVR